MAKQTAGNIGTENHRHLLCRHLTRKGWLEGEGESAFLADSAAGDDSMDGLRMSSMTYRIATGRDAGRKVVTLQTLPGDAGSLEGDAGKVGEIQDCMATLQSQWGGIDVLVASFCIERDYALLHRDRDFDPFEEVLGPNVPIAVVTGPSFAKEVALGLPTAVTVHGVDAEFAQAVADVMHDSQFDAINTEHHR